MLDAVRTFALLCLHPHSHNSPVLQPSDIIRTTQHATLPPPSIFRSIIFLSPSLISHPSCHSSPLPLSLPPSACSFLGPCAGGAITEGGIDSFALMWFGLRRDTAQSDAFSRHTESSLCLHFMCFQTGQSAPLSSARLPFFLSLPPTIALCKKPPTFPPDRQVPFFSTFAAFICSTLSFMQALL